MVGNQTASAPEAEQKLPLRLLSLPIPKDEQGSEGERFGRRPYKRSALAIDVGAACASYPFFKFTHYRLRRTKKKGLSSVGALMFMGSRDAKLPRFFPEAITG